MLSLQFLRGAMRESRYQADLINTLEQMFPGCIVLKNDSGYLQGIPDLVVFYGGCYAMLEVKTSHDAPEQPNQRYYIELFDEWSFAAFISPENEGRILDELQRSFASRGATRIS